MMARNVRTVLIAVVAIGLCNATFAAGGKRLRHRSAADRDAYARPAANRPTSQPRSALDTPGQTTVLTRQVLDDMNATTLRDAMRSTAGVTVGR